MKARAPDEMQLIDIVYLFLFKNTANELLLVLNYLLH